MSRKTEETVQEISNKIKYFYDERVVAMYSTNLNAKVAIKQYRRVLIEIVMLEYRKWHFRASRFKNFLGGGHAPRPH